MGEIMSQPMKPLILSYFHACMLHSSCKSKYDNINGFMGWLMISPIGHNMHHQYGLKNACNFAPIFKIWDRLLGTLNETEPMWWPSDREAAKARKTMRTAEVVC